MNDHINQARRGLMALRLEVVPEIADHVTELVEAALTDAEENAARLGCAHGEIHRLQCQGAFSLDRDPFDLMPAIDAYAEEEISGGKLRECIRAWLAGADFRDPKQRSWEQTP